MEHWLTTTAEGLVILGLVTIFIAAFVAKCAAKLWHKFLRQRMLQGILGGLLRVLRFVEAYIRPFVMSRVLTAQYMRKQDLFRYIAHVHFIFIGFAISSFVEAILMALVAVHFIVNGWHFSWLLFVLFVLTGFGLALWLQDLFSVLGIVERTFWKHLQTYKEIFPKLHHDLVNKLMTEDVENVLAEAEQSLKTAKKSAKRDQDPADGGKSA
jgi:MFS family permease